MIRPGNGMWSITHGRTVKYEVHVQEDYFRRGDPALFLGGQPIGPRLVVIDENVNNLYGDRIREFCDSHDIPATVVPIGVSEEKKTLETAGMIANVLAEFSPDRRSQPIVAIGGGVLTDVVGFAASMYKRGIPWVRFVTTAQMWDAGTGGKTGVDHCGRKSLLGTFHMPVRTIADRRFFPTLPREHLVDGWAEVLKVAIMCDRALFGLCVVHGTTLIEEKFQGESEATDRVAREVITLAIADSLAENGINLWEENLTRYLHFGHTWGPEVEIRSRATDEPLLHGAGVAVDIALSTVLAHRRRMISASEAEEILCALRGVGLPIYHHLISDQYVMRRAHESAIKARAGRLRAPLPSGIGNCEFVDSIGPQEVMEASEILARMD